MKQDKHESMHQDGSAWMKRGDEAPILVTGGPMEFTKKLQEGFRQTAAPQSTASAMEVDE